MAFATPYESYGMLVYTYVALFLAIFYLRMFKFLSIRVFCTGHTLDV
jgi:hypothetical protein